MICRIAKVATAESLLTSAAIEIKLIKEENTYNPDWDIYNCTIESKPAIIGLDLKLRRFAPLQDKRIF
jgi:hypothetical protein